MNRVPGLGLVPAIFSESRQNSLFNTFLYSGNRREDFSYEAKLDMNFHKVVSADSVSGLGYEGRRNELSLLVALRKSFAERLHLNLMLRQEWIDGQTSAFHSFSGDGNTFAGRCRPDLKGKCGPQLSPTLIE